MDMYPTRNATLALQWWAGARQSLGRRYQGTLVSRGLGGV